MRPRLVLLDIVLVLLYIVSYGARLRAQPVTADEVLARAATYVQTFVGRFANVVAEERYLQ